MNLRMRNLCLFVIFFLLWFHLMLETRKLEEVLKLKAKAIFPFLSFISH